MPVSSVAKSVSFPPNPYTLALLLCDMRQGDKRSGDMKPAALRSAPKPAAIRSRQAAFGLLLTQCVFMLCLFALSFAAFGFAQNGAAKPAPLSGRIAFIDSQGQLVTSAPDGSEKRTLTQAAAGLSYQFPAWSPVADSLAVIGATPGGSSVVTIADKVGAKGLELYSNLYGGAIYLYWSPNGQQIGFLANIMGGLELNIVGATAAQRAPTQLVTGQPLFWQWSQDSQELLVHSGLGSPGQVAFYSASGGRGRQLATPGLFNVPGLSASGGYLAYAESQSGDNRIVVRNNDTAAKGRAAQKVRREVPYGGLAVFSWSPTADKLAIMSPNGVSPRPYGPIRLLDAKTGELTPLVDGLAAAFFWSPDGKKLAYLTPFRGSGGQFAGADGRVYRQVQESGTLLELRVADVATGRSRLLTTFSPTVLFMDQFLSFFDQYALSHALWSPNSDALVLPMEGQSGSEVVVVPLQGKPRPIADGAMPFWSRR